MKLITIIKPIPIPHPSWLFCFPTFLVTYYPFRNRLVNRTQQFRLQYELPLLILLTRFVRLIVLPTHRLLALLAINIPHLVAASCHVAFYGVGLGGVDDGVEEEGFAVLAAEIL